MMRDREIDSEVVGTIVVAESAYLENGTEKRTFREVSKFVSENTLPGCVG